MEISRSMTLTDAAGNRLTAVCEESGSVFVTVDGAPERRTTHTVAVDGAAARKLSVFLTMHAERRNA